MMDLNSSVQLRGGMFEKTRIAHSSQSAGRLNRETKESRSFLSQSQSDLRSVARGTWARDDQVLSSRSFGTAGSLSTSLGCQEILTSRSPSFFRSRTLSGFDSSRSSGFPQTGSSFRNDQFFLPSVGIIGGLSQARGSAFGSSLIGNYSGVSGLHSGFGFQRVMTGPTCYRQGVPSGFDGRLYQAASLSSLHQQLPSQVQGSVSNSDFQQASVGVTGVSLTTSTEGSHQLAAEMESGAFTATSSEATSKEAQIKAQSSELEVNDSGAGPADVNATLQQADDQPVGVCNFSADGDHRDNDHDEESSVDPLSASRDTTTSLEPEDPNHFL